MARLAPAALALVLVSAQSAAAQAESSGNWLEAVSKRAETILTGPAADEAQRVSQLETLIAESFDLKALGDFALGRHARDADSAQLARYTEAFRGYAVRNFTRLIAYLDGRALKVSASRAFGEKQALVTTRLGSTEDQEPMEIDWRVRWRDDTPKIIDVFVEGISMALTLRHELSAYARAKGLDALMDSLEEGSLMPPPAGHSRNSGDATHHLLQSVLNQGVHIARTPY